MRIIFIKEFIDAETYSEPVIVKFGDKGTLIDDVTSRVELDNGGTIEFVNPGSFLPVSDEDDSDEFILDTIELCTSDEFELDEDDLITDEELERLLVIDDEDEEML